MSTFANTKMPIAIYISTFVYIYISLLAESYTGQGFKGYLQRCSFAHAVWKEKAYLAAKVLKCGRLDTFVLKIKTGPGFWLPCHQANKPPVAGSFLSQTTTGPGLNKWPP